MARYESDYHQDIYENGQLIGCQRCGPNDGPRYISTTEPRINPWSIWASIDAKARTDATKKFNELGKNAPKRPALPVNTEPTSPYSPAQLKWREGIARYKVTADRICRMVFLVDWDKASPQQRKWCENLHRDINAEYLPKVSEDNGPRLVEQVEIPAQRGA